MAAPPRLHKKLGAKWVEVTKTDSGEVSTTCGLIIEGEFENAASNTRSRLADDDKAVKVRAKP